MTTRVLDKSVGQLTVSDFKEMLREVIQSTPPPYYLDKDGYMVFRGEYDYQAYLSQFPGRLPSEIRAYYINPQGLKVRYSDYEVTPEYEQELARIREEPTVSAKDVWGELDSLEDKD